MATTQILKIWSRVRRLSASPESVSFAFVINNWFEVELLRPRRSRDENTREIITLCVWWNNLSGLITLAVDDFGVIAKSERTAHFWFVCWARKTGRVKWYVLIKFLMEKSDLRVDFCARRKELAGRKHKNLQNALATCNYTTLEPVIYYLATGMCTKSTLKRQFRCSVWKKANRFFHFILQAMALLTCFYHQLN